VKIENGVYRLRPNPGRSWLERISAPFSLALGRTVTLRFSIVDVDRRES
jgi:hypothetical protein